MKLDDILAEMAKELLPNLSSEEDQKLLSQLKKLYKADKIEFTEKFKHLNTIRKSEGLKPLTQQDLFSKSIKQDIKTEIDKEKEDVSGKTRELKILNVKHRSTGDVISADVKYKSDTVNGEINVDINSYMAKEQIKELKSSKEKHFIPTSVIAKIYSKNIISNKTFLKIKGKRIEGREINRAASLNSFAIYEWRLPEINKKIVLYCTPIKSLLSIKYVTLKLKVEKY